MPKILNTFNTGMNNLVDELRMANDQYITREITIEEMNERIEAARNIAALSLRADLKNVGESILKLIPSHNPSYDKIKTILLANGM